MGQTSLSRSYVYIVTVIAQDPPAHTYSGRGNVNLSVIPYAPQLLIPRFNCAKLHRFPSERPPPVLPEAERLPRSHCGQHVRRSVLSGHHSDY